MSTSSSSSAATAAVALDKRAKGLAVATCCHHNCSLADYCGWEFLLELGFTPVEFDVMTHWSGWAHTLNNSSTQSSKKKKKKKKTTTTTRAHLENRGLYGSSSSSSSSSNGGSTNDNDNGDDNNNNNDINEEDEDDIDNSHSVPKMNERVPKPTGLNPIELSVIGKQIKRLFDYGRVCYLRKIGFDAFVVRYCESDLSPECYAIMARR